MSDLPHPCTPQDPPMTRVSVDSFERARRTATDPALRFDAVARELPDTLFSDHPLVVQATQDARTKADRLAKVKRLPMFDGSATIQQIEEELQSALVASRYAAIDDALADDRSFSRAVPALEYVEVLKRRIEAAKSVHAELGNKSGFRLHGIFESEARAAEEHRQGLLLRLKREHLQAHPELLQEQSAP